MNQPPPNQYMKYSKDRGTWSICGPNQPEGPKVIILKSDFDAFLDRVSVLEHTVKQQNKVMEEHVKAKLNEVVK